MRFLPAEFACGSVFQVFPLASSVWQRVPRIAAKPKTFGFRGAGESG
jgi:hypothetical protein